MATFLRKFFPATFAYVFLVAGGCAGIYAQSSQFAPKAAPPPAAAAVPEPVPANASARYEDPLEEPIVVRKLPQQPVVDPEQPAAMPAPPACKGKQCKEPKVPESLPVTRKH